MNMQSNSDRYKAARRSPSQERSKERIRLILAAALQLFRDRGLEEVTTNDIAQAANVPIGSLYRYYPNKDAIVVALTELYITDIGALFAEIGAHPLLAYLSWDEIMILLIDSWVNYSRLNGAYAFLYAGYSNPRLRKLSARHWATFRKSLGAVLTKRCPSLAERHITVAFQLTLAAAELGINDAHQPAPGQAPLYYDAAEAIAGYLHQFCKHHQHGTAS